MVMGGFLPIFSFIHSPFLVEFLHLPFRGYLSLPSFSAFVEDLVQPLHCLNGLRALIINLK